MSVTVMLAAACFAIEAGQPQKHALAVEAASRLTSPLSGAFQPGDT